MRDVETVFFAPWREKERAKTIVLDGLIESLEYGLVPSPHGIRVPFSAYCPATVYVYAPSPAPAWSSFALCREWLFNSPFQAYSQSVELLKTDLPTTYYVATEEAVEQSFISMEPQLVEQIVTRCLTLIFALHTNPGVLNAGDAEFFAHVKEVCVPPYVETHVVRYLRPYEYVHKWLANDLRAWAGAKEIVNDPRTDRQRVHYLVTTIVALNSAVQESKYFVVCEETAFSSVSEETLLFETRGHVREIVLGSTVPAAYAQYAMTEETNITTSRVYEMYYARTYEILRQPTVSSFAGYSRTWEVVQSG